MSLVDEGNRSKNKAVCVNVSEKRPFSFAESHRAAWRTCKSFLFGGSALFGGDCTKLAQQPIRVIVRASRKQQRVRRPLDRLASAKRQRPESLVLNRLTPRITLDPLAITA